MKSYTDISQSKKLTEILPLESSDMSYDWFVIGKEYSSIPQCRKFIDDELPCWSLAALLAVLQKTAYFIDEDANVVLCSYKTVEWNLGINNSDVEFTTKSNPIDVCYEMILDLHEHKML